MQRVRPITTAIVAVLVAALFCRGSSSAARAASGEPITDSHAHHGALAIPKSVQIEHEAIHAALVEATQRSGRVGAAANELAKVLHPHFVREEEIALPPLGLLAPLAAGERPAEAMKIALEMSESLQAELPKMLEEHVNIRAAVEALRVAAKAEGAIEAERLAEELALHAKTEEEVLYPAAILVGMQIRAVAAQE